MLTTADPDSLERSGKLEVCQREETIVNVAFWLAPKEEQMTMTDLPDFPSHVGNKGRLGEGDGAWNEFTIIDEVARLQSKYASGGEPRKYLVLQQIQFDNGVKEVRSGYYMLSQRVGGLPYWSWARSTQLAPLDDFKSIVDEAERLGWFSARGID